MKKLLKAVAFVTVMCMLLSTAAFASYGTATGNGTTKLITANVTGVGAKEQVVLLIIDHEKTLATAGEDDIMYINQAQALENGTATFENIAIKNTETVVDVYVGSAITDGPKLIGNDIDLKEVKNITIANLDGDEIITAYGNNGATKGFAAAITVNIPEGLTVSKMIWGFKLKNEEFRRYSTAQDVDNGTAGTVQFAAAFDLGTVAADLQVENVSAIFLTGDKDDPANTHYTHEELDKPNKKK